MDAGLDNANNATNNPFANSNGTEILSQKEGFLLNLNDGFKQNGSEISPSNEYLFERSTNGKRPASDEFDEDEDMGPETDIDAVDDMSLSPSTEHTTKTISENKVDDTFDPFATDLEEKVNLELDLNLQKQQSSEFDSVRSPREETPTPPADEVHDVALEDNVGESGEDSEDEWNYYKGDTAEKESISKADQEVAKITEAEENSEAMSQLNPDAAEFIPISSPTRNTASPAQRALIEDQVIAQSPRRVTPTDVDINLPNPQEFEKEVKSRPSDVYSNGDDESDGDHKLTSQEVMENFLNGKNIDEIEFHPSTPTKYPNPDEFHFGPNAAPFSTPARLLDQSEASTKAVLGESATSYLEGKSIIGFEGSFLESTANKSVLQDEEDVQDFKGFPKEQDPMSTSFYQDKNEDNNPFDLNRVQTLPDNIDDYLQKTTDNDAMNETISDLPEHNPLENADVIIESEICVTKNTDVPKSPIPTDEDKIPTDVFDNFVQPSAPPFLEEWEKQTPISQAPDLTTEEFCQLPLKTLDTKSTIEILTSEPIENIGQLPPKSPASFTEEEPSDEACRFSSKSPASLPSDDLCQLPKSLNSITPDPTDEDEVCRLPSKTLEPVFDVDQKQEPVNEVCSVPSKSPEPVNEVCSVPSKSPEPVNEVCSVPSKSPEPINEVCSVPSKSPEPSHFPSESPVAFTPEPTEEDMCEIASKSPLSLTPEPTKEEISKSPAAITPEPTEFFQCNIPPKSPEILQPDVCTIPPKAPSNDAEDLVSEYVSTEVNLAPETKPTEDLCPWPSKLPTALVPEFIEDVCQSTEVNLAPETKPTEDLCPWPSKSPTALVPQLIEDVCQLPSKSPTEQLCQLLQKSPEVPVESPEPDQEQRDVKSPNLFEVAEGDKDETAVPTDLLSSKSPLLGSIESPMEDVTSSVKDDVSSPINSPVADDFVEEVHQIITNEPILEAVNLNYAQELSNAVQEALIEDKISQEPIANKISQVPTELSPKSAISEQIETESVATADVNSFLERSNLSDVTSPLSPNEPTLVENLDHLVNHPLSRCVYPLPTDGETVTTKREIIEPEFPVKEIASPSEESTEETKIENQEAPAASVEANAGDEIKTLDVVGIGIVAAGVATSAAVITATSENEKKSSKPASKTSAAAATKRTISKTSTSPVKAASKTTATTKPAVSPTKLAATTRVTKTSVSPKTTALLKTSTPNKPPVSKPAPKPRAATTKPIDTKAADDKKQLLNGDLKAATTRPLQATRKLGTSSAPNSGSKTTSAPRTSATAKLSPTKTPTDGKPTGTTSRPTSATTKTTTRTALSAAPKARPTSLTTKTSTTSSSSITKTSSTVSTTKSTTATKTTTATSPRSTTTATAKPKPATTTTSMLRSKATTAKQAPKGPDTEKQLKETANKQLTANRTTSSTTRTGTGKTTTTVQKTEAKAPGSRTITTKTTVTTIKAAKKPAEITRNINKTKTTTTKTTKLEQNGLTNGITITQETTAIISSDPQMIKDVSPIEAKLITDNSQLPETNIAD